MVITFVHFKNYNL